MTTTTQVRVTTSSDIVCPSCQAEVDELREILGSDVIQLATPGQHLTCRCGRHRVTFSMRHGVRIHENFGAPA